jgi:hypothetical protein
VASLLPLHNYYSILIRLLETSSSESGETWVKNIAAEFCLQDVFTALYLIKDKNNFTVCCEIFVFPRQVVLKKIL